MSFTTQDSSHVEQKVSDPTCKILTVTNSINFQLLFRGQTALIIRIFFRPFLTKHKLEPQVMLHFLSVLFK